MTERRKPTAPPEELSEEAPGELLPTVVQDAGDQLPPTAVAYETGEHLVYVRTATSGQFGVKVDPHSDVPADALPTHVETLENLGLVTRKP